MTASANQAPPLAAAVAKVRRRVLPLLVVMFVVNYLDRVNVGFIKAPLATALGIDAAAFGFGAGLFFIGYLLFEVPSNLALERFGGRVWLARIAISWGLVAAAMALVQTEWQFYAGRFVLGAAEAGFFPGVVYYLTRWLPQRERGRAMAVFLSGSAIASILSGPLAGLLMRIEGLGLAGWQWMLVIEGLASVVVGVAAGWWLDAHPGDARWLTAAEREALDDAIARDAATARRDRPRLVDLLRDPQVPLFCGVYFAIQLTIYAVTFWLPAIIKEMLATPAPHGGLLGLTEQFVRWLGYTDPKAVAAMSGGFLNSLPWIVSIVGMIVAAHAAARWKHPQVWVAVALVVAGLGMLVAGFSAPAVAFGAICFAALGFKSAASLFWPLPQQSLDPRIAAAGIALINSLGNLGGWAAPITFGWIKQNTGSVYYGLYFLAFTSLLTAALVFFTRPKSKA